MKLFVALTLLNILAYFVWVWATDEARRNVKKGLRSHAPRIAAIVVLMTIIAMAAYVLPALPVIN